MLSLSIAPVLTAEAQLKDIVQNLYNLIVQSYDHHGNKTQDAMKREMFVRQDTKLKTFAVLTISQPVAHPKPGEALTNRALYQYKHPT
jgi:hypothetical protein